MAIHAVEAPDLDTQLADAAASTEALARRYFGDAAYVRSVEEADPESGETMTVFEVHYCFPDPERDFDRLAALHMDFTHAFGRELPVEIVSRVVLAAVPNDAD